MNQTLALHTAARRWLIERKQHHIDNTSNAPYGLYVALDAIKNEVEYYRPEDFESVDELFEILKLTGQTATNRTLKQFVQVSGGHSNALEVAAIVDIERQHFCDALSMMRSSNLQEIEPLPYRRTLSKEEGESLWKAMSTKWAFSRAWYPICGPPRPDNAIAFLDEAFYMALMPDLLSRIFHFRGIERVFEILETSEKGLESGFPEREIDVTILNPTYGGEIAGIEKYWCTQELDWLLYASHESSITVGGKWLIDAVQDAWPTWQDGLYEQFDIARWHLGNYRPGD